ncbi:hypothetical protein LSH36_75g01031 [Paralvinella palmiformis]|uniref:Reverse transcriptase domain-containing protein n=1 Tax=Paralvinella palmiformis TaxID=53620 RepID=A0AAD9K2G8_9ANNE|nr:hypothetical protein LSH36_75g01031 [Paralvinella palmiformis]
MPKTTWSDVAKKSEACLADISTWMSANRLKLNEEKTELIIFNPKHQVRIYEELKLQVGNDTLSVGSSVKNLGIHFDTSLTTERQVNAISKVCYYQIRNIGHIRRYIGTLDVCKTLAHALITSRIEYGNALLCGFPSTLMTRLQKVQKSSARRLKGISAPYPQSCFMFQLARTDLNKKENNVNPKKIDVGFASSIFIEKAISIEEQFESLLGEVKKYHKNDCKNFDPSC